MRSSSWRRVARRGVSALAAAALAVSVSTLGLAVSPAAAQSAHSAACWGEIPAAAFGDLAGLSAESVAAIDCVSYYGITKGTAAEAFSPGAAVTRAQMARFLVRTVAAVELELPAGKSRPFDDVGSLDAEGRTAVARLHELGITRGITERTFGPSGSVTRSQMALFLQRLLKLTDATLPAPAIDAFDDLAAVSEAGREAVGVMSALGVMDAAAPRRFDPRALVTREDMARFLARVLEAAGARPVRLELSVSSVSVLVGGAATATVRAVKANGEAYPGLLIDVFAARGLTQGGACDLDTGAYVNGGDAGTSQNCRIDRGDPRTDSAGRVTVGLAHSAQPAVGWIYAWAGERGEEFDDDKARIRARVRIGWHPTPTGVTITDPIRPTLGQALAVGARLTGRNAGDRRMVLVASGSDGAARTLLVGWTDHDGRVSFSLPGRADPAGDSGSGLPVSETLLVFWDRNGNSVHDGPAEVSAQTVVAWTRA